jgi:ubiquitin carboxyl-terminal hydrolase 9/24
LADEKIGKACGHRFEKEEQIEHMSVTVRGNKNLLEALDVKGELLSDDNKYFCEKCQKKVDAIKRTCVKTLPSVLLLQLKRFDYDWENDRPVKVNDLFTFPMELDMEPYTVEALAKRDLEEKLAAGNVGQSDNVTASAEEETKISTETQELQPSSQENKVEEMETADNQPTLPPVQSSKYELSGVVVHQGTANAGHYYSYVKIRDPASSACGKWLKLNDESIEEVELTDAIREREFFGGKVMSKNQMTTFPVETDRNYSAYMLVYDRIKPASAIALLEARKVTFARYTRLTFEWH